MKHSALIYLKNYLIEYHWSEVELDTLCQWEIIAVVDGAGGPPHVLFPAVTSAFSSSAGFLFSAKGASDLCATCADIAVNDTAVASQGSDPFVHLSQVVGEQRWRKSLRNVVIEFNGLFQSFEFHDIEDWHE